MKNLRAELHTMIDNFSDGELQEVFELLKDNDYSEEMKLLLDNEYEDYMKKDLEALKECTAILLCPEWNMSNGCKRELKQALEDGLHIMVD